VRQLVAATLSEAEALRSTSSGGGDFAALARQYSVGAGKEQGGDVGWFVRGLDLQLLQLTGRVGEEKAFFEQLEPVAFALEVGQISQPVKGPGGYYLVKVEERVNDSQRSLAEVRDQIHTGLLIQKRQQIVQDHLDRLWKKATVDINEQRLGQL
jgi:parvulin-like peptidyl-prolyl isomerase